MGKTSARKNEQEMKGTIKGGYTAEKVDPSVKKNSCKQVHFSLQIF